MPCLFGPPLPIKTWFSLILEATPTIIGLVIIAKWYPYIDDTPLSFLKIKQGFKQSNFKNLYFINSIIKTKYYDLIPKLSYGGYSQDTNLGLALAKGKKNKLILGTYNLLDLINNNETQAFLLTLKEISKNFIYIMLVEWLGC